MRQCEHCGRSLYLNRGDVSCDGCGAYLPAPQPPPLMYDSTVFDAADVQMFLGSPGMNIPVNMSSRSRMSDVIRSGGDGSGALA